MLILRDWSSDVCSSDLEAVNRGISKGVLGTGEGLRVTQSGLLNWNVALIVVAAIAVLGALLLAAGKGG
jgi:hypothetical protein